MERLYDTTINLSDSASSDITSSSTSRIQLEERHCSSHSVLIHRRQTGVGVLPPHEGPEPG
jgi:hypothetical protein